MEPTKEAASAGPVMTMENGGQVLDTIDRLKAKDKNGALTKDEQIELHHNENILARTQATNLEVKQKAHSKLPTPRELHSTELAAHEDTARGCGSPTPIRLDTHSPIQQKQSRRSLTGSFLSQSGTKQQPRDKRH